MRKERPIDCWSRALKRLWKVGDMNNADGVFHLDNNYQVSKL